MGDVGEPARWGQRDLAWQGEGSYAAGAVLSRPLPLASDRAVTSDDQPRAHDPIADQLDRLPSIDDDPVVWDHRQGGFVRVDAEASPRRTVAQTQPRPDAPLPPTP